MSDTSELRAEVDRRTLAVMDGHCSATGKCRTKLTNEILSAWAEQKLHESILVCRVAEVNPMAPDSDRKAGGK